MDQNQVHMQRGVTPMQDVTKRNVRRSRTWSALMGNAKVEWKLWTDRTRWKPEHTDELTEFFQVGPVRWRRWYWLRFGLSITQKVETDPHERMNHVK